MIVIVLAVVGALVLLAELAMRIGCGMMGCGGYVVEGHVPVKSIQRLLKEKPKIAGISLPGMPAGSPGMTGTKEKPFEIYEFGARSKGEPKVYSIE